MERGVNHRQTVITPPPQRRKKRGARLAVAYALQGLFALLAVLLVALLICGVLYVRERLLSKSDGEDQPKGENFTDTGGEATWSDPATEAVEAYTVVLDAGHGGVQSGCAFDGVLEKDITLAVTLLAAEKLRAEGVTVILTREDDTDVSLDKRCRIANDVGANLFVSIHCNSYTEDTSVSGFEGYYHNGTKGQRLAEYILEAANALGVKTRNVKDENFQVIRDTTMPAVLMEIGFLSNPAERNELQSEEYQNTIAKAISNGVMTMRVAG